MKKLFFILSVSLLFYACGGAPERGNYIPKSAKGVVTVNMKGIVDEIKWDILFGGDLFKLENFGKDYLFLQLMKDPTKSGVEFMERAYVFYDSVGVNQQVQAAIIPLSDGDVLGEFLSANGDTVKTEGDFLCAHANDYYVLWNDKTAFLVSGQNYSSKQAADYVAKSIDGEKVGLLSTEFKGKVLLGGEDHIAYWAASAYQSEKVEMTGALNFKNGQLQSSSDIYFDEKGNLIKLFQQQSKIKELASATDLNKTMLSLGLCVNMKLAKEYLNNNEVKGNINALMYLARINIDFSDILSQMEGDVFIAFDGLQIKMEEKETVEMNDESGEYEMGTEMKAAYYPLVTGGVSLADTSMIKMMVKRILYNFAAVNKQGVYSFGPGNGFLFFKEKNLFYVSDSSAVLNIQGGKVVAANAELDSAASILVFNTKDLSRKISLNELVGPGNDNIAKKVEASIEGIKLMTMPLKGNVLHSAFQLNGVNKEENIIITILKLMKNIDAESPEA